MTLGTVHTFDKCTVKWIGTFDIVFVSFSHLVGHIICPINWKELSISLVQNAESFLLYLFIE